MKFTAGPMIAMNGVAVALMGLLGPWAKMIGFGSASINGLDTEDGKVFAVILLLAALTLIGGLLNKNRGAWILLCLFGLATVLLGFFEYDNIAGKLGTVDSEFASVSIGWGIYATIIGGAVMAIGAFAALRERVEGEPPAADASP